MLVGIVASLTRPAPEDRELAGSVAYQLLVKHGNMLTEGVARVTEPAIARGRSLASEPSLPMERLITIDGGGIYAIASLPAAALWHEARQAKLIKGLVSTSAGILLVAIATIAKMWVRVRGEAERVALTERRQAAVIQAIPDVLFVFDRKGVHLEYRGGDKSLLVAEPEYLLGRRCEEVLPPEAASQVRAAIAQACSRGEPIVLEYTTSEQETQRWFEARVSCMGDERALVLSRDVTDRRRVLQQAHELHALRLAINEHTLFSIADARGRILDINDGFCRISGYSREELLGQDHRLLNSGHHPKSFWDDMWKTVASGKPWRAEVCNRAKDGSLYWVDSTNIPLAGEDGEVERYISLRFEITERKRLEVEKARSMGRYSALFEGSRDAVLMLDESGFVDCNRAALDLFGVGSVEGLRQLHWEDFLPECQAHEAFSRIAADKHIQRAIHEGSDRFEWIHKRIDTGESFYAEVLLSAHAIDEQRMLQAVVRDISERKSAELEVKAAHDQYHSLVRNIPGVTFILDITQRVEARQRLTSIYEALSERIVLMDADGHIVECNPAAEAVLGIPHAQIVGRTCRDLRLLATCEDGSELPFDEIPAVRTLRTGESVQGFVLGIVRPDGEGR